MSLILHIDTSTENGIYFLSEDGKCLKASLQEVKNDHASNIVHEINDLIRSAGKAPEDIAAIDVCAGPGSYTGLRIGLSTAKGICYTLSKPLMMTHKLFLMAETLRQMDDQQHEFYVALIPARQDEYYVTIINKTGDTVYNPRHVSIAELKQILTSYGASLLIAGDSNDDNKELEEYKIKKLKYDLGIWSFFAAQKERSQIFSDITVAEPFYLKAPFVTHPKNN